MVRKLDAGPTLGHRVIELDDAIDAAELYARCAEQGAQLLAIDLMDYVRGNLSAVPQDEAAVTIAPKIDKSESEIDWSRPARAIHDLVRGLAMGPNAQTTRDGQILKIHRTRVADVADVAVPRGRAVMTAARTIVVGCGEGALELLIVQPASRARMPVAEYLKGYPLGEGSRFGREAVSYRA